MKKFKFQLQSLLKYRKYLERKAKMDFAKANADVLECEKRIKSFQQDYANIVKSFDSEKAKGINAHKYQMYTDYLLSIELLIKKEQNFKITLLKVLKQKQKELKEKSVQRKMLENLQAQKKEQYYQEMRKTEQEETDDMVLLRKAREINK